MKQTRKKLPVDLASFEKMRTENYLYVDKTQHIYRMATEGTFYFLARPRRFGKSLLVSTLTSLFRGRKELFDGLWIAEQSDWDWQPHPVIVLDFNSISGGKPEELKQELSYRLNNTAQQFGVSLEAPGIESRFEELILKLFEMSGKAVVILIDEYDKRIIDHLGRGTERMEIAKANRDMLKSFFGVLKGQAVLDKLRFVFLTGVSRFSKVSLFSELNNLRDISMLESYADMLGYTQQELETCFTAEIAELAQKYGVSVSECLARLAREYNGYRFSKQPLRVYNPFSVLNALNERDFRDYWFESGTPTFLVETLKEQRYHLPAIEGMQVSPAVFSAFELEHLRPEALLFQTGYLTITDVQEGIYTLDYPNQEVKHALAEALLLDVSETRNVAISSLVLRLPGYLQREDFAAFFEAVRAIFASIPYDIQSQRDEAYYHTIFYLLISASGITAQSSVLTCDGRIDMIVAAAETIYIIEFKCNQSADAALRQMRSNRYANRFQGGGKALRLMGINFNTDTRNVEEWKLEPV
ncbi:AAA-ATPase [Candidatus Moduliflexus flocculans]|uniref:AAA-ATPase n=1 Tax=Candidatus Moduliflexus flocculans TaxID=1499966 RepID=A0A081BQW0_9BACT|nr:AAA-ATPase [Candidatus Moduliflexus flocculans]